jgi:hypothetical protein
LNGVEGVPSHVSIAASAASASVIPTSRYFGTNHRFAAEINAHRVMCPKHARGAHGSHDYARHQEAATKALSNPFTLAKHFHAKNAVGEALDKFASPVQICRESCYNQHPQATYGCMDKNSPFIIHDLVDPYLLSIEDCWVLNNWGMLTLSQCMSWQ